METFDNPSVDLGQDILYFHDTEDLICILEDRPLESGLTFFGDDQDFIQIAQLVADQKVLKNALIKLSCDEPTWIDEFRRSESTSSSKSLHDTLSESFPSVQQCDLKAVSELEPTLPLNSSSKAETAQDNTEGRGRAVTQARDVKGHNELIQKLQPPYLGVRRGEDAIDIAPPALYFWEELGLAPLQQSKDVMAFCIYPDNQHIRNAATTFLATSENSYQSCKFGRHLRGSGLRRFQDGMVPFAVPSATPDAVFESLEEVCTNLGNRFLHWHRETY